MGIDLTTLAIKVKTEGAKTSIKDLERLEKAGIGADHAAGGMSSSFSKLSGVLAGLGVGLAAKKLIDLGGAAIKTGSEFETMGVMMRTTMGSVEGGEEAFGWVRDFVVNTPYQLQGVGQAFLLAKNMGVDPMSGSLQAMADQASALGGGQERLMQVVLGVGKAMSKGKMDAESWNMLAEKGVPVINLFKEALGKSEAQIMAMRTAGKLGREEIQKFLDTMGKENTGASARLMDTLAGKISTLKDAWAIAQNEFAQGGVLDAAKESLVELIDLLKQMTKNGDFEKLGESAGAVIPKIVGGIENIIKAVKFWNDAYIDVLNNWAAIGAIDWVGFFRGVLKSVEGDVHMWIAGVEKELAGLYGIIGMGDNFRAAAIESARAAMADYEEAAALAETTQAQLDAGMKTFGQTTKKTTEEIDKQKKALHDHKVTTEDDGTATGNLKDKIKDLDSEISIHQSTLNTHKENLDRINWSLEQMAKDHGALENLPDIKIDAKIYVPTQAELDQFHKKELAEIAKAWGEDMGTAITNGLKATMHDGMHDLWTGDGNIFDDLVKSFSRIGEESAQSFTDSLFNALSGNKDNGVGVWAQGFNQLSIGQRLGVAGGGAANVYNASQGPGGLAGFLQGAMGGAAMGGSLASLISAVSLTGIGAIAGAVIGGALGLFGGGTDTPSGTIGITQGGYGVSVSGQHQGDHHDPAAAALVAQTVRASYYEIFLQWRDVLKKFGDASLWDLFGGLPDITGTADMTYDQLVKYITEVLIPDQMSSAFRDALAEGFSRTFTQDAFSEALDPALGDAGLTGFISDFSAAVQAELANLPGEDRIKVLGDIISAVGMVGDILGTTFSDLTDHAALSFLENFQEQSAALVDQIDIMGMGFEDMTLGQRAREIENLGQSMDSLGQATEAMIRQIQGAKDSIEASFAGMSESIRMEDMSNDAVRAEYVMGRINDLMGQLGSATSPEEVQSLTQQLQGYFHMMRGFDLSGTSFEGSVWNTISGQSGTMNDWLLQMIDQANTLAQGRLDEQMASVEEVWQTVQDAASNLGLAFVDLTGIVTDFGSSWSSTGGGPSPDIEDPTGGGKAYPTGGGKAYSTGGGYSPFESALLNAQNSQIIILKNIAAKVARPPVVNVLTGSTGRRTSPSRQTAVY